MQITKKSTFLTNFTRWLIINHLQSMYYTYWLFLVHGFTAFLISCLCLIFFLFCSFILIFFFLRAKNKISYYIMKEDYGQFDGSLRNWTDYIHQMGTSLGYVSGRVFLWFIFTLFTSNYNYSRAIQLEYSSFGFHYWVTRSSSYVYLRVSFLGFKILDLYGSSDGYLINLPFGCSILVIKIYKK